MYMESWGHSPSHGLWAMSPVHNKHKTVPCGQQWLVCGLYCWHFREEFHFHTHWSPIEEISFKKKINLYFLSLLVFSALCSLSLWEYPSSVLCWKGIFTHLEEGLWFGDGCASTTRYTENSTRPQFRTAGREGNASFKVKMSSCVMKSTAIHQWQLTQLFRYGRRNIFISEHVTLQYISATLKFRPMLKGWQNPWERCMCSKSNIYSLCHLVILS